jgi:hypothetical protein
MSSPFSMSQLRRACYVSGLAILVGTAAVAQSSLSSSSTAQLTAGESSSSSFQPGFDNGAVDANALRDAAAGLGSGGAGAAGQDNGSNHGMFHHLAFEAGGGINSPVGSSGPYLTWGGNFTVGGGLHFGHGFSMLAEYQFLDNKLPGTLIAETGANGGNAHIWGLTLNPVFDLLPKRTNSVYVTGGGGFYRKVTNFTDPEETEYCDYYYCETGVTNAVVGHFSSNQGGYNFGAGLSHRFGGMYNDGTMKVFAEARFLDVMTPASAIAPNGLDTATVGSGTKLVPVTVGVRW